MFNVVNALARRKVDVSRHVTWDPRVKAWDREAKGLAWTGKEAWSLRPYRTR